MSDREDMLEILENLPQRDGEWAFKFVQGLYEEIDNLKSLIKRKTERIVELEAQLEDALDHEVVKRRQK